MLLKDIPMKDCPIHFLYQMVAERENMVVTAAVDDEDTYGFIVYDKERIYYVYVKPEARGSGVANFLINAVLNLNNLDVKTAVASTDLKVIKLFVNNGFVPVGNNGKFVLYSTITKAGNYCTPYDNLGLIGDTIIDFANGI